MSEVEDIFLIKDISQDVIITIILFSLMDIKYQIHKDKNLLYYFLIIFLVTMHLSLFCMKYFLPL